MGNPKISFSTALFTIASNRVDCSQGRAARYDSIQISLWLVAILSTINNNCTGTSPPIPYAH